MGNVATYYLPYKRSDNWLDDYLRRMKAKGGNKYAIVATVNKIATIYYKMVLYKKEFNPVDLKDYQQQYKLAKIAYLVPEGKFCYNSRHLCIKCTI